jgi:hypothetical protein
VDTSAIERARRGDFRGLNLGGLVREFPQMALMEDEERA